MAHVRGRQPIGINQPPSNGSDYPLVAPSDDISRLFGDFYLAYDEGELPYSLPLRIVWLAGFGTNPVTPPTGYPTPTHDYDLIVHDADGATVFDSTEATYYDTLDWDDRLRIIEWRTDVGVCRCTIHIEWSEEDDPITYDDYIEPENGILDGRTYLRMPPRVTSLTVSDQVMTDDIDLFAGYNIELNQTVVQRNDGARLRSPVVIAGIPGRGEGLAPACEDIEPILRRINRIEPTGSGNFLVDADDCFRWQRLTKIITSDTERIAVYESTDMSNEAAAAAIKIYNDCRPCCECDYFVRTYEGLRTLWDYWRTIGEAAVNVRDIYSENRERWQEAVDCRQENNMRLVVDRESDCNLFIGVNYCNNSFCCLAPIEIRITLRMFVDGVLLEDVPTGIIISSTYMNGELMTPLIVDATEQWPVYSFHADLANPQEVTTIRMRIRTDCDVGTVMEVNATVHPVVPDECELDAATIPSEIQDLWGLLGVANDPVAVSFKRAAKPMSTATAASESDSDED